jgi:signal transduction histidine kinase
MNNLLKHSQATKTKISMGVVDGDFSLVIEDNGVGFKPESPEHAERNGLTNMRTRIAEIGGEISIESSRGHGSRIRVRVAQAVGVMPDGRKASRHL